MRLLRLTLLALLLPCAGAEAATLSATYPNGASFPPRFAISMGTGVSTLTIDAQPGDGSRFRVAESGDSLVLGSQQPGPGGVPPCSQAGATISCTPGTSFTPFVEITNAGGSNVAGIRDRVIVAGAAHGDPPASWPPNVGVGVTTNGLMEFFAGQVGGTFVGSDIAVGDAATPADIYHPGPGGCVLSCDLRRGADRLEGGGGADRVNGGEGDDVLLGGAGDDQLEGGPGDDTLRGGEGTDSFLAGDGNDAIFALDGLREIIECGPGTESVERDEIDDPRDCPAPPPAPLPPAVTEPAATTQPPATTPPAPTPPASPPVSPVTPRPRIAVTPTLGTTVLRGGRTRVRFLRIPRLRRGDSVAIACRGRGCRRAANRKAATVKRSGTLSLTAALKGMVLSPGATLVVTVRREGARTRVVTYTFVRGRPPRRTTQG